MTDAFGFVCPECKSDVPYDDSNDKGQWDAMGAEVTCPKCGTVSIVQYDESFDEETGDESCWFWLERSPEADHNQ